MKINNSKIEFIYEQLIKMRQDGIKFPVKVGFAILRNSKTLEPIVIDLMASRKDILDKNGVVDEENPSQYNIPPEKIAETNHQLLDLNELELEVNLVKIDINDLINMELTMDELEALNYMTEDEAG